MQMAQLEWHALHTCFGQPLFPYDFPDTPSGLSFMLQYYVSPFAPSDVPPARARDALRAVYEVLAERGGRTPLVPVERDANMIRVLLPKPSRTDEYLSEASCLVPVNVKVNGRGSISLPCAIRVPTKQDLASDRAELRMSLEAVGLRWTFIRRTP